MPPPLFQSDLTIPGRGGSQLSDDQHFSDVVPSQEEFYRGKVAEQCLNVAIIKHPLQPKAIANGSVHRSSRPAAGFPARDHPLHLQGVFVHDVEAVARRIRPGILGVEKCQHHAPGFQYRPQPPHDGTNQAFIEIVSKVPAKHDIKMRCGILQVLRQKLPAVEHTVALIVFRRKVRLGRSHQEIFAVDLVCAFGEKANVVGRGGSQIEHTQRRLRVPNARQFAQPAGAARQFLSGLRRLRLRPAR
jgi:hypothetical protein